ncbi:MAG: restriction endonuclease subunit S [Chloroflexi bacterium]|nr:restriction endonuclease subunit S [Chloroflexota bacterium]
MNGLTGSSVPDGWRLRSIAELTTMIMDYRGRTPKKLGMEWGGGGIPALSARNVKRGLVDLGEGTNYGSDALYRRWMTRGDIRAGDIVMTTEAPLGNVALISDDRRYILSQRTVMLRVDASAAVPEYIYFALQGERFQRLLAENASGSTATGIQRRRLEQLRVLVPDHTADQRRIAYALSDAQGWIGALGDIIRKKVALREATAQQLLTGRRRLPGYAEPWESLPIQQLADVDPENLGSGTPPDFNFRYISLEDVDRGRLVGHSKQAFTSAPSRARRRVRPNDVLVGTVRPNLKSHLLFTEDGGGPWICSTGFAVIRGRPGGADPRFIFYQMMGDDIARQIDALLSGSNYPAINSGDVRRLLVAVPPLDEQRAIAGVLAEMDADVFALRQRAGKALLIRKGMADQLLSGKTRLAADDRSTGRDGVLV